MRNPDELLAVPPGRPPLQVVAARVAREERLWRRRGRRGRRTRQEIALGRALAAARRHARLIAAAVALVRATPGIRGGRIAAALGCSRDTFQDKIIGGMCRAGCRYGRGQGWYPPAAEGEEVPRG